MSLKSLSYIPFKANMNRKFRMIFALSFLFLTTVNSADASIFDWISGQKDENFVIQDRNIWSLDKVYTDIRGLDFDNEKIQTIQQNSIIESNSPKTPKSRNKYTSKTFHVTATAYSSTPDQTDDSPFITASGTYVRDGIIATNFLPMGTLIKIPDLYGDKIFIVEDRMNRRYVYNIDIWFPERNLAKNFGVKRVEIEVISES